MRLSSLPPAVVRLHIWKSSITTGALRPLQWHFPTAFGQVYPPRDYATVHVGNKDKIFELTPATSRPLPDELPVLTRQNVVQVVEEILNQRSDASLAAKRAVVTSLDRRVRVRTMRVSGRRRALFARIRKALGSPDVVSETMSAIDDGRRDGRIRERGMAHFTVTPAAQSDGSALEEPSHTRQPVEVGGAPEKALSFPQSSVAAPIARAKGLVVIKQDRLIQAKTFPNMPMPSLRDYPNLSPSMITLAQPVITGLEELCNLQNREFVDRSTLRESAVTTSANPWLANIRLHIDDILEVNFTVGANSESEAMSEASRFLLSRLHTKGVLSALQQGEDAPDADTPLAFFRDQYPQAPAALFQPCEISNIICQQCNSESKTPRIETSFQTSSSGLWTCELELQIPDIFHGRCTGQGKAKRVAKRESWIAMANSMHTDAALSVLFPPPGSQPSDVKTLDPTPPVEVEIVNIEEQVLIEQRDAKMDIYNYAARYSLVPHFEISTIQRKSRRRGSKVKTRLKKVTRVCIRLPEHAIEVSAYGTNSSTAEVAAAIAFKQKAEEQRTLSIPSESQRQPPGFEALNTETGQTILDYYQTSRRVSIELEREDMSSHGVNEHSAQVMINGAATGKPVVMRTKKDAETVAYLTAAIVIAHDDSTILPEFINRMKSGRGALGHYRPVQTTVERSVLNMMRDGIIQARRAGLPDSREALDALDTVMTHRSSHPRRESANHNASQRLLKKLERFESDPVLEDIRKTRASLPMSQHQSSVVDLISNNIYSIVVGATGSGKTTQVPQILFDDAIRRSEGGNCNIICTQPRRLAASSVARRVAVERGETLQDTVGYHVRGEAKLPQYGGSITYCTTGVLLEQLKWNPDDIMDRNSHLVIDEVHERDVSIDFLLIVLKKAIKARQDAGKGVPKVVLMSATMDAKLFSEYMANNVDGKLLPCPHLSVPGRTFPVQEKYLEDILIEIEKDNKTEYEALVDQDVDNSKVYLDAELAFSLQNSDPSTSTIDWKKKVDLNADEGIPTRAMQKVESLIPIPLIAATIAHICKTSQDGAVLVFLPGLSEITAAETLLTESPIFGIDFANAGQFEIFTLHSTVTPDQQRLVLDPVPLGCRKIILSTNIAETSVTIPDVKYVVDSGKLREKRYDQVTRISALQTVWESSSNARQRAGRAGRVSDGIYYALYSRERRSTMAASGLPEILRSDLQETCLSIKAQGFPGSVQSFLSEVIEPPAARAVELAVQNLKAIEAFTDGEGLTALGQVLAKLPVHPALGKMILLGIIFRCLDPMIIIGSMGTERALFFDPIGMRETARKVRSRFSQGSSDHLALINAFKMLRNTYKQEGPRSAMSQAHANHLHFGAFRAILHTANQIEEQLCLTGILPHGYSTAANDFQFGGATLNTNSKNSALIKCLLLAGVYPNLGVRGTHVRSPIHRSAYQNNIMIHPSSMNHVRGRPKRHESDQIYAFSILARSVSGGILFMRDTTLIDPLAVFLFGGRLVAEKGYRDSTLIMDDWLPLKINALDSPFALRMILEYRKAKDRMLASVFKSLSDLDGKPLSDDPVREIFADGLVQVLDAANQAKFGATAEEWVPREWRSNRGGRQRESDGEKKTKHQTLGYAKKEMNVGRGCEGRDSAPT